MNLELYADPKRDGTRKALRGGFSEERIRQVVDHIRQVHAVEQVEDFGAKLHGGALLDEPRNVRGLHEIQVDVGEAGSGKGISSEVALLSGRRQREGRRRKQSLDEIAPRRGNGIPG